jgi:hypothetical protein
MPLVSRISRQPGDSERIATDSGTALSARGRLTEPGAKGGSTGRYGWRLSLMTGKNPPERAIAEARRWAGVQGFAIYTPEPGSTLPFHFVVSKGETASIVTVRRPKYLDFNLVNIAYSCRTVIKELRALTISPDIRREIWVWRNAHTWYRYLVLPETLEYIEDKKSPDNPGRQEGGGESPTSPV